MPELTEGQRWLITIAVMLATVLEILDGTIVSIALPHMMGSFGATTDQITWVLTSYIVSSAILMPLSGFLINRLGSKKLLLINVIGFLIASMLCGISTSLSEMVLFRVLQGVFGASLLPLSQFILRNTFPPEQLMKAMAIWGVGIMAGPVLGPTIGGFITESFNWRWIFYINAPLCLIDIFLCLKFVQETPIKKIDVDKLGIFLLVISIGCFQIFLDRGNSVNWFESSSIRWLFFIFIFSFIFFIYHGMTYKEPVVNLKLFLNKNFTTGCAMLALFAGGLIGVLSLQPLYMENLLNYPADYAGLVMAPRGIASAIAMGLVPKLLTYTNEKLLIFVGIFVCAVSTYLLSCLTLDIDAMPLIWIGVIQGIGMGLFFVPISSLTFATLSPSDMAEAAGLFSFCRNVGTSVGISLLATLITRETQINWNSLGSHISIYNQGLKYHPMNVTQLSTLLSTQASNISFLDAYYAVTIAFVVMLPLIFLLRRQHNTTGHLSGGIH